LVPDGDDKIYSVDNPTCGNNFGVFHTREVYRNFSEWLEWNGGRASDDHPWHYWAMVDDDLDLANRNADGTGNDDTVMNVVGTGHPDEIPESAIFLHRE
jgi:hypothetical protein